MSGTSIANDGIDSEQVVLITGGGSGIAAAAARMFAARGARVVIGDLAHGRAKAVAAEIEAAGGVASAHALDVRDDASVRAFVAAAVEEHGGIDVVLPVAGVFVPPERPLAELEDSALDLMLDVNVRGVLQTLRAAVPHMRDHGAIVLTSSTSGLASHPGGTAYSATKAAIVGLGRSLALEVSPQRIRVNVVCPGGVDTPLTRAAYPDTADEVIAEAAAGNPLGRLAQPEDIAEVFWFLASDRARHVNGVVLIVDGGDALRGAL